MLSNFRKGLIMEYDSQIKYHAEELHDLLEQEPSDVILAQLCVQLETIILGNPRFKNIDAATPVTGTDIPNLPRDNLSPI